MKDFIMYEMRNVLKKGILPEIAHKFDEHDNAAADDPC